MLNQRQFIQGLLFLFFVNFWVIAPIRADLPAEKPKSITFPLSNGPATSDTTLLINHLQSLHKEGYLHARLDSFSISTENVTGYFYTGAKFSYQLKLIDPLIFSILENEPGVTLMNGPYSFNEFDSLSRTILSHFSNNGYPFARLYKKNVEIDNSTIIIDLMADAGNIFYFGKIVVDGNVSIGKHFIQRHFGIIQGTPYNQSLADAVPEKAGNA